MNRGTCCRERHCELAPTTITKQNSFRINAKKIVSIWVLWQWDCLLVGVKRTTQREKGVTEIIIIITDYIERCVSGVIAQHEPFIVLVFYFFFSLILSASHSKPSSNPSPVEAHAGCTCHWWESIFSNSSPEVI